MVVVIAFAAAGLKTIPVRAQQSSTTEQPDNYVWLEDIHGERQMAWVKAENERTAAVLEKDQHFAPLEAEALQVRESDALSKTDKQSWVGEGLNCLEPENELCLVGLSAGGEDAETLREMDLKTGQF